MVCCGEDWWGRSVGPAFGVRTDWVVLGDLSSVSFPYYSSSLVFCITGHCKSEIMVPDSGQDDFQAKTAAFCTWIQQQPGTAVSPKIRIADLRAQGQGRGVSKTLSFSIVHNT